MVVIQVEVISDVVCAWCYIGKRVLEQAIALYKKTYPGGKDDTFEITWSPYYLNYGAYSHSVDKSEFAAYKLQGMSPEKIKAITQRVNQAGSSVGINLRSGGKVGPTRAAHRLIYLSQQYPEHVQNALVDGLFEAYHELEEDISSNDVLRAIAVKAGLDGPMVEEYLDSDKNTDIVDEEAANNRQRVNSGVPLFLFQGIYRVDGASDVQEFLETFINIKEGSSAQANNIS